MLALIQKLWSWMGWEEKSDLVYCDASKDKRENIVAYFNGKAVRGVIRGNASEGWVECYSETCFQPKRMHGKVLFKVLSKEDVVKEMQSAIWLW